MAFGEELYLPAESRNEQQRLLKMVTNELSILERIDPVSASNILVNSAWRSHRLWVVLKKVVASPTIAFVKSEDGTVSRVKVPFDAGRARRLRLMLLDGLTKEEIEEIEGELSSEEKAFINGGLKGKEE